MTSQTFRPSPIIRRTAARLGRRAAFLAAAVAGLLASVTALPAFAYTSPMGDGADVVVSPPVVPVPAASGMPGWQIALIAIGAALAAAVLAVYLDRRLSGRRGTAAAS
jgi:hypothetical protein